MRGKKTPACLKSEYLLGIGFKGGGGGKSQDADPETQTPIPWESQHLPHFAQVRALHKKSLEMPCGEQGLGRRTRCKRGVHWAAVSLAEMRIGLAEEFCVGKAELRGV